MSLTPREHWRLYGRLPEDAIEDLLDAQERKEQVAGVAPYIKEAMGQFPAEDFLSQVINRVHALARKVRGDNREEALAIAEVLDDVAQTTFYAADHGRSELRNALKELT